VSYDPSGTGAEPQDVLVRRGIDPESTRRLGSLASNAKSAGFGYGVSVTSLAANRSLARDPEDFVGATRQAFEQAGFPVRYSPTRKDSDHHTVLLPEPVTDEVAAQLNAVLGRISQGASG
jgi:hypothetical protein